MMNQRLRRSRLFKFALGLLAGAALLVACTPMPRTQTQSQAEAVPSTAAAAAPAPRLGTQWGEGRESNTRSVQVQRYTPDQPDEVASIGYNDAASVRRGVGANPERRLNLQLAQGDVEWSVIDESGRATPLQRARRGSGGDENFRLAGAEGIDKMLRQYNVVALVGPTMPAAWPIDPVHGDAYPGAGAGGLAAVAGYPHLTVPMGMAEGLPVGLSFIGPKWSDALVLQLGYAFEQARGPLPPPRFLPSLTTDPRTRELLEPLPR